MGLARAKGRAAAMPREAGHFADRRRSAKIIFIFRRTFFIAAA